MHFDGHYIKNGFKAMATSHYRQFNHIATPEELDIHARGYSMEVEPLCLDDFRHAIRYYGYTQFMGGEYMKEWQVENMFMECQGNLGMFHQSHNSFKDRFY